MKVYDYAVPKMATHRAIAQVMDDLGAVGYKMVEFRVLEDGYLAVMERESERTRGNVEPAGD